MKVFSKAKFLADPGGSLLYQANRNVRRVIDKLDGQDITDDYIKIGLGDCRIAVLPGWLEERGDK